MRDNTLLRRIKDNIGEHNLLSPGCRVVAGVSGGADSVCLLSVLAEIREEYDLSITAVHVNHMLRGPESDADEEFTAKLCEQLEIPLRIFHEDVGRKSEQNRVSTEEAGREARYAALYKILGEVGADVVAVAHNFEDQAETVMMNILRGCGTEGLAGMGFRNGSVIRPLLNVRRREILDYLAGINRQYRTDSSNNSCDYTRNRIRNLLFPYIREHFSVDPAETLNRLSAITRRDEDFLAGIASEAFTRIHTEGDGSVTLGASPLKGLDEAISGRIVRMAWEKLTGSKKRLEASHVEGILALVNEGATGKSLSLPNGLTARISYGKLIMGKKEDSCRAKYSYPVAASGDTDVPEAGGTLRARILDKSALVVEFGSGKQFSENSKTQIFDYLKINCGINIRSRREGDRISPKGAPGEKKLKEFFIDRKIPAEKRDSVPLVASGRDIIWVVGMRTSEKFMPGPETGSYLVLSWSGGSEKAKKTMGERK